MLFTCGGHQTGSCAQTAINRLQSREDAILTFIELVSLNFGTGPVLLIWLRRPYQSRHPAVVGLSLLAVLEARAGREVKPRLQGVRWGDLARVGFPRQPLNASVALGGIRGTQLWYNRLGEGGCTAGARKT